MNQRQLFYHGESDSLFVIDNDEEKEKFAESADSMLCDDVTGIESFEKRFREMDGYHEGCNYLGTKKSICNKCGKYVD